LFFVLLRPLRFFRLVCLFRFTYAGTVARTCYRRTCHVSSYPTPHRQAPFAPSGPPGLRGTHLRFAAPHPLRPVIHKVHLALLRMTPKPPRRGMYAALRAKEEIVHPASFVDPSTPSEPLRFTLALRCPFPVSSFSFLHKFSFVRRGMGGGCYRHDALQPPLRSAHRPAKAGALMFPARCLETPSPDPASLPGLRPAGSSTQIRLKRFTTPVARLLRKGHASMAHHLPGRAPFGGLTACPAGRWSLRPHPGGSFAAYA